MSTAFVASTTLAPATARVAQARVGNATSFTYVDPLEQSLGARPGDEAVRYDERWQDVHPQKEQSGQGRRDIPVQFGGIYVTREVGTTIMQAQAQASMPQNKSATEAETQIRVYEYNQALAGTPEVTTNLGMTR